MKALSEGRFVFGFSSTFSWLVTLALISPPPSPISPSTPAANNEQDIPKPVVTMVYDYYPIHGSSSSDIQSAMTQHGPWSEVEEQHYFANTEWRVKWSYDYQISERGCEISNLEGSVDITFTLPQWNAPTAASTSLVSAWNQFIVALQIHENGHMRHGVLAAQDVLQTLSELSPTPSCETLKTTARIAARRVVRQYNQQDIEYDRETNHGLTQGAVFPPIRPNALQEMSMKFQ